MARKADGFKLTASELATAAADGNWGREFPPILTIGQAAKLSQLPMGTLYDWSSRQLLRGCGRRSCGQLRFSRDRFVNYLFVELNLSPNEIAAAFADSGLPQTYPPILTIDQAAELGQFSKATLYLWSSRGLLKHCAGRAGKYLRFFRDRYIQQLLSGFEK